METSTPLPLADRTSMLNREFNRNSTPFASSPLRRRSIMPTPAALLENINDEQERASRRSIVDMQRRLSNLSQGDATLNDSFKFAGEQDMMDHYRMCTKLFTENKITAKNVWKLHIIDLLKHMVKKFDKDALQIAATSLDISAKVYSIRVDDIHSDGLKLASNMSRICNKESAQNLDDNENFENGGQENAPSKKPKKKTRLLKGDKCTICKDPKSLQAPLPKLDSVFFSTRTDMENSAVENLFTNMLKMDNSGYKFMLLSNDKDWTEEPDPVVEGVNDANRKKYPLSVEPLTSVKLCAPFSNFQLGDWDPEEEEKQLASKSFIDMNSQQVIFDDNGIPMHELDGSIHDMCENPEDDMDDIQSVHEQVAPQLTGAIPKIIEFNPNVTNGTYQSEYSYNSVIPTFSGKYVDQIWAGPSHWKLKFIRRSSLKFSGQPLTKTTKQKMGRKKAEPKYKPVNYDEPYVEYDMTKKLKIIKKPPTADPHKITMPYQDSSCTRVMEHVRELMEKPGLCPPMKPNRTENQDYEVGGYNYQNPSDSQYCSQHSNEGDVDIASICASNDDRDNVEEHQIAQQEFVGENLIDAPEEVPKLYVPYALQAKKMNMKKLKSAVWQNLTQNKDAEDRGGKVVPTTFSKMFKELPSQLPQKMQKEVSCPLAFVALLHLCNEQNLELKQHPGDRDFTIEGPKK